MTPKKKKKTTKRRASRSSKAKKTTKKAPSRKKKRTSGSLRSRPKKKEVRTVVPEVISNELPKNSKKPANQNLTTTSRALSPSDPLRQYLKEIQQYALLEPEEELALARELKETGSLAAAKRLVSANLRLVVKIAFEYRSVYANTLDLIQEGNIGLMKAVSKYDPDKGARLGYYAAWWIRSYILKFILDNFRLVKIGTTQAQKKLFYQLVREKERLESQGIETTPKLLAERLDVKEKEVVEMQQRLSSSGMEMSLDTPVDVGGDSAAKHMDFLVDRNETADESLARNQLLELLKDELPHFRQTLDDREALILEQRLLSEQPKTLQEVANEYGLTRERVRQIEAKVVIKLREFLRQKIEVPLGPDS